MSEETIKITLGVYPASVLRDYLADTLPDIFTTLTEDMQVYRSHKDEIGTRDRKYWRQELISKAKDVKILIALFKALDTNLPSQYSMSDLPWEEKTK